MLGPEAHHRACSTIAASAASTGCSRRPAARTSTICSTTRAHETLPDDRLRRPCREPRRASPRRSTSIAELEAALETRARRRPHHGDRHRHRSRARSTEAGGAWWDVAVPEVSERAEGRAARAPTSERAQAAEGVGRLSMTIRIGANPIGWSNDDMPELGGDTPLETMPRRGRGRSASPAWSSATSSRAIRRGAQAACSAASAWPRSAAGIRPNLLERDAEAEIRGAAAAPRAAKGDGRDVFIVAECTRTRSTATATAACPSARVLADGRLGRASARG